MLREAGVHQWESSWGAVEGRAGWQQIDRELRRLARATAALDVEIARWLREAERARLWRKVGFASALEYLESVFGFSPKVAMERLRVASALGELRGIEASLAAGSLTYSAARELTRVATPTTEQAWLRAASGCNLRQIEQLVAGKSKGAAPDDQADPDQIARVVRLELLPHVAAMLREARAAFADEIGSAVDDSQLIEMMCRRSFEAAGTSTRPAHQIAVTVCSECKRGWQHGAGIKVELPRAALALVTCDADVVDLESEPSRVTSTIPRATRRKVMLRDERRCRVPGCRAARNLDVHHIVHREHGGTHDPANLVVLCSGHHTAHHEGTLRISGRAPDQLVFERVAATHLADETVLVEAKSALVRLGYKPAQARAALDHVRPHVGAGLEALIRAALQHLAKELLVTSTRSTG